MRRPLSSPHQAGIENGLRLISSVAALLLVGTALLHVSAAGDHTNLPIMMVGFLVVGTLQAALGVVLVFRRPRGLLVAAGLALTLGALATWLLSRTAGLPFLPGGHMEPIGFKDGVTVLFELATVPFLVLLRSSELERVTLPSPRFGAQALGLLGSGMFALFVPAFVLGGGEHHSAAQLAAAHGDDEAGHEHGDGKGQLALADGGSHAQPQHGHSRGGVGPDPPSPGGGHHETSASPGNAHRGHRQGGPLAGDASSAGVTLASHGGGHGAHGDDDRFGGLSGRAPSGSGTGRDQQHGSHGSQEGRTNDHGDMPHHDGHVGGGGQERHGGSPGRDDNAGDGHGDHGSDHGAGGDGPGGDGERSIALESGYRGEDGELGRGPAVVFYDRPNEEVNGSGHSHGAPCRPTAEQQAAADAIYEQTAAELGKYENNLPRAMADGFTYVFGPTDRMLHMVHLGRVNDPDVLKSSEIESFMYYMTDTGLVPIGGMYIMPEYGERGPQPGGCLTQWHHHGGVIGRWATLGTSSDTPEMMHVYTYPGLDPWGHYSGRELSQLWTPGSWIPSVCRESGDANDGCLP